MDRKLWNVTDLSLRKYVGCPARRIAAQLGRGPSALAYKALSGAFPRFLIGRLCCRDRGAKRQSRVRAPALLVEIATITARGLAGQPMKRGTEPARVAEADIEPNRRDGQFAIRQ
jgi:hypothetical protein